MALTSQPSRPPAPKASSDRTAYYAQAAAWAHDTLGALRRSRGAAWLVAALAVLVALLNGAALMGLQPLTHSVPYRIDVDAHGGRTQAMQPLQPGGLQSDPAVTQSMIVRYVTAREEFDAPQIVRDYRQVELMSDPAIRASYAASMAATSGASPLAVYPAHAVLRVEVQSISLLDAAHALVRFATVREDVQGAQPELSQAQVAFRYTNGPMREVDRFDNPLGFQVTAYGKQPL